MAKERVIWSCIECGLEKSKWQGQCPQCLKWNVFHQEIKLTEQPRYTAIASKPKLAIPICEISSQEKERQKSGMEEIDRVLGGGLVSGSLTLLGGEPGIGKSTCTLQFANRLARLNQKILYVSGEESIEQVSLRGRRLSIDSSNLFLLGETSLSLIKQSIEQLKPDVVIIDSIQIIYKEELPSLPGSLAQIKEVGTELMYLAKNSNIAIWLIGHVTKTGELAGPRVLEHLVDTVLYFEGDRQHHYRILRVVKNRFGPTDEIAVFRMTTMGLEEVANPSAIFLEDRREQIVGSSVIPILEGSRPILVEVQSLVADTVFSSPMRKTTGIDANRLSLLLAVLEKRAGFPLHRSDVFASIAGGIKAVEPASDLGIIASIVSSLLNRQLPGDMVIIGEVGLAGDVRRVPRIDLRLKEAMRMGFKQALIPKKNHQQLQKDVFKEFKIFPVDSVDEALRVLMQD